MGFHHVAFATRDLPATHRFYTHVMDFALAKVVAAKSPEGGWAKHVFYAMDGGDMIATVLSTLQSASVTPLGSTCVVAWNDHVAPGPIAAARVHCH